MRSGAVALSRVLERVRRLQPEGPLVFGGSVLVEGYLRRSPDVIRPLLDAAGGATPIPVADGVVGAAVLALREGGVEVDAPLFTRMRSSIRAAAAAGAPDRRLPWRARAGEEHDALMAGQVEPTMVPTSLGSIAVHVLGSGRPTVLWHSMFVDGLSLGFLIPALL